jgi:hypothetical protein
MVSNALKHVRIELSAGGFLPLDARHSNATNKLALHQQKKDNDR